MTRRMFRTQNHVLHVEALRNREVLSVETAAVIAGYTPFRLLRMLPPDKAPFRRVGNRWVINAADLKTLIKSLREKSA